MKTDKIFNNTWNDWDNEFQSFGPVNQSNFIDTTDIIEDLESNEIESEIDIIFKASPYYEQYTNKIKISKIEFLGMFLYFEDKINKTITSTQLFIFFAEYMNIDYTQLYNQLDAVHKEKILKELDDKLGILKKKNIKALF
jgi:hypothetical protein